MTIALRGQMPSSIVYEDAAGHLRYETDAQHNRIADFSHAGYRGGGVSIPGYPVVQTIQPVVGDNTAHIQAAIDQVSALTPDANGVRGALLLDAGTYRIDGTLSITSSGVVLRGVGQGSDPLTSTILQGAGDTPHQRNLINIGDGSSASWTRAQAGTRTDIVSPYIPAGSRTLEVASTAGYSVGDNVIAYHPSTAAWLASVDNGGTDTDPGWNPGEIDIYYNRYIAAIDGSENKITLDAPIYDHFDRSLAQAELYVYGGVGLTREVGIENMRIEIQTASPTDENHAWTCINMEGVEDSWVKNVTGLHFGYAMFRAARSSRLTVTGCKGLEPHSLLDASRRYNFVVERETTNILFDDCEASEGRHSFVSNGTSSASGIVWRNSSSSGDHASSEGHRRWAQGLLFEDIAFTSPNADLLLGLYNRGRYGTGHGWSSVNSVAWNVSVPGGSPKIVVQQPPARQNYAIACQGQVTGDGPFAHPAGFVENTNTTPAISSLYAAQLSQRLTDGVAPDGPARLAAVDDGTDVRLSWLDIASGEAGYEVVVSVDGGSSFSTLATLPANVSSYVHSNAGNPTTEVRYKVFATGNVPSAYSNEAALIGSGPVSFDHYTVNPQTSINTTSTAGRVSTFSVNEECEILNISVTDPTTDKLPAHNAYIYAVTDEGGQRVKDISGRVSAHFRVASAQTVDLDALFLSGGGTQAERTITKRVTVPGGLSEWTEVSFEFGPGELDGFDPTDLQNFWFYLDRGRENFAGNEFYIDFLSIGAPPSTALNSSCAPDGTTHLPTTEAYYRAGEADPIERTNDAGVRTTFTRDDDCEWIELAVTNPASDPVTGYKPYSLDLLDADGNDIKDLTGRVEATMQVWSAEEVSLSLLFRSGGGTQSERTGIKTITIPGNAGDWTTATFSFSGSELEGLDPADIRDAFFYLDRGADNFAGNRFVIDDIAVGTAPDASLRSSCSMPGTTTTQPVARAHYQAGEVNPISDNNYAGVRTTFSRDDGCEWVALSVSNPIDSAIGGYDPYIVTLLSETGDTISDLTDRVEATMTVWSEEEVELSVLFRSGDGEKPSRTGRKSVIIPGKGSGWTTVSFSYTPAELGGLDPADVRDFWFYLDHGTDNFAGNRFVIDDITVGAAKNATLASNCSNGSAAAVGSLPVSWIEFGGRVEQDHRVSLHWTTASEQDADRYEIEYAESGREFVQVGTIDATGNSRVAQHYAFTHAAGLAPAYYYRIRQVDLDGAYTYSKIIRLSGEVATHDLRVYPNPARRTIKIDIPEPSDFQILDASARRVRSGMFSGHLSVADLKNGTYYLIVNDRALRFVKR